MDIKSGVDTRGFFTNIYGPSGIKWGRGAQAEQIARQAGLISPGLTASKDTGPECRKNGKAQS